MKSLVIISAIAGLAQAGLVGPRQTQPDPVYPSVKGTPQILGIATDPSVDRDSCGSAKFDNRALWACRDTEGVDANGAMTYFISSSASWTDFNASGQPSFVANGGSSKLPMYGDNSERSFYPILPDECGDNQGGGCPDGSRYAIWPDSPPLVVPFSSGDGSVLAYTWIKKSVIEPNLTSLVADPAVTLYRVTYQPGDDNEALPQVAVVAENFWGEGEMPYGVYGNVIQDGIAYLWGKSSNGTIALAKVPAASIEDKSQYEFWVNGAWASQQPAINDPNISIPNVSAGGQGTYYYSDLWNSYVWIGQAGISVSADFFITTAPEPQGPWIEPTHFYSGVNGNYSLSAYTLQAHPALVKPGNNEMYLSYTKVDVLPNNVVWYSTPVVYLEWQ